MPAPTVVEDLIARGDLSKLTPQQRVVHHNNVCKSLGLNPLTQPFQYVTLNGRLVLYAKKDAADQLRSYADVGVDQLVFGLPNNLEHDEALECIELFGDKVIPNWDPDPVHRTTRMRESA